MPNTIKKTHEMNRKRRRSEAEREAHRQEIERAGGWYLYARLQRQAREQANMKEALNSAKAAIIHQEEAPKVP